VKKQRFRPEAAAAGNDSPACPVAKTPKPLKVREVNLGAGKVKGRTGRPLNGLNANPVDFS
jgi:hypothetical protein